MSVGQPRPGGTTQRIRIASRASAPATAQVKWLTGEPERTAPGVVAEFVPVGTVGDRRSG